MSSWGKEEGDRRGGRGGINDWITDGSRGKMSEGGWSSRPIAQRPTDADTNHKKPDHGTRAKRDTETDNKVDTSK